MGCCGSTPDKTNVVTPESKSAVGPREVDLRVDTPHSLEGKKDGNNNSREKREPPPFRRERPEKPPSEIRVSFLKKIEFPGT